MKLYHFLFTYLFRDVIIFQFRLPASEMERLIRADSEETHRQILERFAQDLPITNRTIKGGIE